MHSVHIIPQGKLGNISLCADPSELYPHLAKWWSTAHVGEVQSLLLLSTSNEELDVLHRLNPGKAQKCRTERAVLERLVMVRSRSYPFHQTVVLQNFLANVF